MGFVTTFKWSDTLVVHTILFSIFLTACASQPVNAQAQTEPIFSVTAKNADDQIAFQHKDNTTTIEIKSPLGIGSAKFKLEAGVMPEVIILQLHLKGLEDFRLISAQHSVSASVSSGEGFKAQSQRKISGNSEQVMLAFDPLWLDIEIKSPAQKVPPVDGHFEIVFPREFMQETGNSFEIQWIDFYR